MKIFPNLSKIPVSPSEKKAKPQNDYARDLSSDHLSRTANKSNTEDTNRQKLRKTFLNLDI